MANHCHNTPALPKQTQQRGILPDERWNELHDFLTLALDALGDRPADFTPDFLRNAVMHQRLALQITHRAIERMGPMTVTPARKLDFLCETHQPRKT